MKIQYDFSKGSRGPVLPTQLEQAGRTPLTICLDDDIVDYFLERASDSGGLLDYQDLINQALRDHVNGSGLRFEETLRRMIREELKAIAD